MYIFQLSHEDIFLVSLKSSHVLCCKTGTLPSGKSLFHKSKEVIFFLSLSMYTFHEKGHWNILITYILKPDSHLPRIFFFICFNESPLKLMKNYFYFMLKALFVLKVIILESYRFGYVQKQFAKKVNVNFKVYDVTARAKNNLNTHIAKHLKK